MAITNELVRLPPAERSDGARVFDLSRLTPEKTVSQLIEHAMAMRASDLFLVTDEDGITVFVRQMGMVRQIASMSMEQGRRCLTHIKANAQMDTNEKRHPCDGRWIYRAAGRPVDLRINVLPTMYGDDLGMRLLDSATQLLDLESLGMTTEQYEQLSEILASPSGLVLVAGPTGSGKTTTLYACLRRLHDGKHKINTIEDPIEYVVKGIRQSQVNALVDLGYAELLRSVLRQSPDVIMIGEIRDPETAQTAVHAANTGHLVLATVHAAGAPNAIQSMRSHGVNAQFLATSLRAVISQRLVRTICPHCKVSFDLQESPDTYAEVKQWLAPDEGKCLHVAKRCDHCDQTGYVGRSGVFEVMQINSALRTLVSNGATVGEIRTALSEQGMLGFREATLLKLARGQTTTEEVFRIMPPEHLMLED